MASSSTTGEAHDTPLLPLIRPQGNSTVPTLRNLKLNHEWIIGEPMPKRNERVAAVYSILISETGQSAEDLEAHVFALDGSEKKLRKHQQRCIDRMRGRTKLKLEDNGMAIVVIATYQSVDKSAPKHGVGPHSLSVGNDWQYEIESEATSIEEVKQKTSYQRELQRIRQKERRRAKRAAKNPQHDERMAEGGHKIADGNILLSGT